MKEIPQAPKLRLTTPDAIPALQSTKLTRPYLLYGVDTKGGDLVPWRVGRELAIKNMYSAWIGGSSWYHSLSVGSSI